ncbi:MAG: DUF4286 family protein [Cyclobacteriaceae bacterium]|nr:DUF4286 family protein [Cyclobacteriaceae bacterium]
MILYNITFNVEKSSEEEWLSWISTNYIPSALASGAFHQHHLFRLLTETANDDSTFALQFITDSLASLNRYLENEGKLITEIHNEKFRHRHVSFMTVLEKVG